MPNSFDSAQGINPLFAWHSASRRKRTQPAIAFVAAQFGGKITLDHVAALCSLSTSQFCRVFKREQGVSFRQYLLHYRLERACERLNPGNVLAKEVAYSVGFNDLSYFTWAFKRQVGVCPSQYICAQQVQDRPNA
jgi:two-component system, response regulator YesN